MRTSPVVVNTFTGVVDVTIVVVASIFIKHFQIPGTVVISVTAVGAVTNQGLRRLLVLVPSTQKLRRLDSPEILVHVKGIASARSWGNVEATRDTVIFVVPLIGISTASQIVVVAAL